jgi:hypothetical protein
MKRPVLLLLAVLAILCAPAVAGDAKAVLGKWQATIETPRGNNEVTMEFTGSEEELAGTWTDMRGASELVNVKFADGKLTFQRNVEFQGSSFTIDYSGTVDGDTLSLTMSTPRGDRQITATRVK